MRVNSACIQANYSLVATAIMLATLLLYKKEIFALSYNLWVACHFCHYSVSSAIALVGQK